MTTIDTAFQRAERKFFLPDDVASRAEYDIPLPIGYGVTNSQPSTVKRMLEWLDVREGDKILDVGSGSGWTTALFALLTGEKGHVDAVEIIPELVEFGRLNCQKVGIKNVSFFEAGKEFGLPKRAPYDRILVSAAVKTLPIELISQLKSPGKLVIPVGDSVLDVAKSADGRVEIIEHTGYVFVPLIG